MTEQEHLEVARRLSAIADRLYQDGDAIAAGVMLWGAVNRVLNAIALQHRLDSDGKLPRRGAVLHHLVSAGLVDANIHNRMYAARELHGHFYNSHLAPNGVAERVSDTRAFIADLIGVYHSGGGGR